MVLDSDGLGNLLVFAGFPRLVSQLVGRWKGYVLQSKPRDVSFFVMLLLSMFHSLCFPLQRSHHFKNEQFK